jgi:hypothetical protein
MGAYSLSSSALLLPSSLRFWHGVETESYCVAQAGLELGDPPSSASQVLGLHGCAATPTLFCDF